MQGNPRRDREWEHWPGRRAPDDRIRHRLKALFSATDEEEAVEALIVERSFEIAERTEQLQATIADLERREEQTGRLRSAVEEMLRHGSAELDDRHAELAALALELGARDEQVQALERDLAVRKQELGAVELRRAAVERHEAALAERKDTLDRIAAELARREADLVEAERRLAEAEIGHRQRTLAASEASILERERGLELQLPGREVSPMLATHAHVLYAATGDGYRLFERDGRAPEVGAHVELEGRVFVVTRIGRSSLPGDRRACAYLEHVA